MILAILKHKICGHGYYRRILVVCTIGETTSMVFGNPELCDPTYSEVDSNLA